MQVTIHLNERESADARLLEKIRELCLETYEEAGTPFKPQEQEAARQHASAYIAAAQGAMPAFAGIETDSKGFPWDGRIHAATRAKNADGTWRARRGVDELTTVRIEKELKTTMSAVAQQAQMQIQVGQQITQEQTPESAFAQALGVPLVPTFAPSANVAPPAPFVGNAVPPVPPSNGIPEASAGAALIASPSSSITPIASPSSGVGPTFAQLIQKITAGYVGKTMTTEKVNAAIAAVGLPGLPNLASRPDLVAAVAQLLEITI